MEKVDVSAPRPEVRGPTQSCYLYEYREYITSSVQDSGAGEGGHQFKL